jgi:HEXXH motif-containing protein
VEQLDSLALGRFDRDAIRTLRSAQRSRRLLLLSALLHLARTRPDSTGPLPPVDVAWQQLLRAESVAPGAVAELLSDPQVGTWIGHALRRLRDVGHDRAPLWFHVGRLHAIAVAAAVLAGVRAELAVPVWAGDLVLPSLGCLRLPVDAEWSTAEVIVGAAVQVRCAGTTVELDPRSDQPRDGWFPSHTLRSTMDGLDLVLRLDDLAPYRGLDNPVRPAPLDATEVARWQASLDGAWRLLVQDHPDRARQLAVGMTSVVPLPATFRFRPHSSSVEDGFGSAIVSEPHDAAQLAVTLAHEFQHSVVNGVRHLVTLTEDDYLLGYAPWRDDPRPIGALLHGVAAFTAVAEFWAVHRIRLHGADADLADFEFALWRHQTETVLHTVLGRPALTEVGARFVGKIAERLARLRAQPVSSPAGAEAEAAAADHAAGWRACHLVPDADLVRTAAAAWAAGRPAPRGAESIVEPGRRPQRLDAKAALMRIRIADPGLFAQLRAEQHLVAHEVDGASAADVAYVAGDLAAAHRLYLTELSTTPNRAAAWSGLGLTLAATGQHRGAELLLQQPELARAVTKVVADDTGRQPPPDELAAWLAEGA